MGVFSLGSNKDYIKSARYPKSQHSFKAIVIFALIILAVTTVSRLGLSLWQLDRVNDAQGWSHIILQGLRVDIATLCWLLGIAGLGTALFSGKHVIGQLWTVLLRVWLTLGLWLIVFLEISTPSFIQEYGLRPNRLYVEYLIYPKEVLSMLWAGRKLELLLALVVSMTTLYGGWRLSGYLTRNV